MNAAQISTQLSPLNFNRFLNFEQVRSLLNLSFFSANYCLTVTIKSVLSPFSKLSGDLSGEIGHSNFE